MFELIIFYISLCYCVSTFATKTAVVIIYVVSHLCTHWPHLVFNRKTVVCLFVRSSNFAEQCFSFSPRPSFSLCFFGWPPSQFSLHMAEHAAVETILPAILLSGSPRLFGLTFHLRCHLADSWEK